MAFYREDLDGSGCEIEGCSCNDGEVYFHPRCHPRSPTWVSYFGDVLTLTCAACKRPVGSFVVASRRDDVPAP